MPETLRAAFDGADRLLFISGPLGEGRVAQQCDVVAAARDVGVGHIAYTSGLGADFVEDGVLGEHHATEQAIRGSDVPFTLLRHPIYSDFFINPDLQADVEAGELRKNAAAMEKMTPSVGNSSSFPSTSPLSPARSSSSPVCIATATATRFG
jgi:uncharacterized protein YbjT (DUF2867 family)